MVLSLLAASAPVGPYTAWWKVIPLMIVVLLWGRLITWSDKDSQEVLLPRVPLNIGNLLLGILGLFLFFVLPGFPIALLVLIACVATVAAGEDPEISPGHLSLGGRSIRTDIGHILPLTFYGPRGTIRTISAATVLDGQLDPGIIRDRIVLIGATATGTGDVFPTARKSVV